MLHISSRYQYTTYFIDIKLTLKYCLSYSKMLSKLVLVFRPDDYNLCLFLRAARVSNQELLATRGLHVLAQLNH